MMDVKVSLDIKLEHRIFRRSFEVKLQASRLGACGQLQPLNREHFLLSIETRSGGKKGKKNGRF